MALKCYIAEQIIEVMFLAPDGATEPELRRLADMAIDNEDKYTWLYSVDHHVASSYALGWDDDSIVHDDADGAADRPQMTAAEALALNKEE